MENLETPDTATVAGKRLKQFLERIEKLDEERKALSSDMRDVFAEAKGTGFDTKTMRRILKLRKMEAQERQEQAELEDLYLAAIGMD